MSLCYFPDGSVSPLDIPCNTNAKYSACCRANNACLSTGYCFGANDGGPNILTRSTCTDPNFADQNCPYYCRDVNRGGAAIVIPVTFGEQGTFCCSPFNSDGTGECDQATRGSAAPFLLPNGNVITNRTTGEALPLNETATPSVAAVSPATVAVTTTGLESPAKANSSNSVTVGAGIGVPLGVLLVVAIAWLLFEVRRRRRLEQLFASEGKGFLSTQDAKEAPSSVPEHDFKNHAQQLSGTPIAELGNRERI